MKLRSKKGKTQKRAMLALFLTPLFVPLALLISKSPPVFQAPPNTQVLVSRRNPFVSLAGPAYFERLANPNPPMMFWEQMKQVSSDNQNVKFGLDLSVMNSNFVESRNQRQSSFKVLGIPQISMSSPSFRGSGSIRNSPVTVYLWSDGHGGSIMELWVSNKF